MTDYVLVDTNAGSDMMKGSEIAIQYRPHLMRRTLGVYFITVGELYCGAEKAN